MADTVLTSASASTESFAGIHGPFWTSTLVGGLVYANGTEDVAARKSTDGGTTYGGESVVQVGTVLAFDAWFDRQTPGDTGTKIHVVWGDGGDSTFKYAAYDIAAGTWGSVTTIASTLTWNNVTLINNQCFVTKTRNGNIVCGYVILATSAGVFRSTDSGANFSSRTSCFEANAGDVVRGLSCNTDDGADAAIAFWDISADEISIKVYDDSANSWTETSISTGMVDGGERRMNMGGSTRLSDGHVIFTAWNAYDAVGADLKAWDLNINSVASPTVTAKTDVLTDSAESICTSVFINQNTNAIHVTYCRGTAVNATIAAFYKKSTDGGATWGTETAMQVDAEDDERVVGYTAAGSAGGQFQPMWFNDDLTQIYYNTTNQVLVPGAGGSPGNSGNAPGRSRGNPGPGGGKGGSGGGPIADPLRRSFRAWRRRTR